LRMQPVRPVKGIPQLEVRPGMGFTMPTRPPPGIPRYEMPSLVRPPARPRQPPKTSGGANMFLNMLKNAQAAMPPPASVPRRSKPSGFLGRRRGGLVLPRVATRVEANSAENEILNLLNGM